MGSAQALEASPLLAVSSSSSVLLGLDGQVGKGLVLPQKPAGARDAVTGASLRGSFWEGQTWGARIMEESQVPQLVPVRFFIPQVGLLPSPDCYEGRGDDTGAWLCFEPVKH